MDDRPTVREACRRRMPLDGVDAQALEHALTITERERDEARERLARIAAAAVERDRTEARVRQLYAEAARRALGAEELQAHLAARREALDARSKAHVALEEAIVAARKAVER